ncbi:MAG: 3'(2'),5'-bisphosphate nucleotidase CysQ [Alphaproteobacteria bacterium]|nr:3'(2'),5'-bisphosphate nucleotidase CysQ [Alphaproteobacteria bacterium]
MSTYARELEVAKTAARDAGRAILEVWSRDFDHVEKDGGKGPLTEADLAANQILIDTISAAFPGDAILSEETRDTPERLANRRCWIIDPLDGTREFTLKLPEFCVSVGFVVDGAAVVGVLYNPATDELIAGEVGVGTTLNGSPAQVSRHDAVRGGRFLVSRSESEKGWFDKYEGEADMKPMGSVAWKFGLVSVGRAEASFTPKPRNEWDLCGGVACILAAGGRATNGKGEDYRFNRPDPLHIGVCGTNGVIHDAVLQMMQ